VLHPGTDGFGGNADLDMEAFVILIREGGAPHFAEHHASSTHENQCAECKKREHGGLWSINGASGRHLGAFVRGS
jgi:hypothetical protein